MSAALAWGLVCGLGLGLGLWSLLARVPRLARPRLTERVAPYVADVSDAARRFVARRPADPLPVIGTILTPGFLRIRRRFVQALGGASVIALRLRQAGSTLSVERFRSQQLVASILGLAAGLALVLAVPALHSLPLVAQAGLPAAACVAGFALRDWALQRAARSRMARISGEFPTVVEFLSLSLTAGEGILDALTRVARTGSGELSRELAGVVSAVNTGIPLQTALNDMASGLRLPALTRLVDSVTTALERGTPLAEVLGAQSQDARDASKRALLEIAGKKEVAMLVPLVFLILPITVLFAIYPGVFVLYSGF